MTRRLLLLLPATLAGCAGLQSALDPRGPAAAEIARLSWVMFGGATLVTMLVTVLLLRALMRSRPRPVSERLFIIAGGIILPVVTLTALLAWSHRIGNRIEAMPDDRLVVEVTGLMWWWQFRYLDANGDAVTANELHLPVGRPVELRLQSADVIHTFWVPNLAGKRDLIPGKTNRLMMQAGRAGVFRGQCNEFCGDQHALMAMLVIAQPPSEFDRWLERQRQPARLPESEPERRGHQAFMQAGCADCHRIRGTAANGDTAPDLTHFGSRRTIAAATLNNSYGNLQSWIASAQHIKPENRMPDSPLDGPTLHALATYLGSLE